MAIPTGILFYDPRAKPLSTTGQFQSGCYLCFFSTGTTTPVNVYADGLLATPLSQPAAGSVNPSAGTVAASDGRFVPIYLNPAIVYRCQMYSAAGVLLEDTDPLSVQTVYPGLTENANGDFTIAQPSSGVALTVNGATTGAAMVINGVDQPTTAVNTITGGELVLTSVAASVNSGGILLFGAFNDAYRFASIKGMLINGGNNAQGGLSFALRKLTTDGALTEVLGLAPTGVATLTANSGNAVLEQLTVSNVANGTGSSTATAIGIGFRGAPFYGWRITNTNDPSAFNAGILSFQRGTGGAYLDTLSINNSGNVTIAAASSGPSLTLNGGAGAYGLLVNGSGTSGQSLGIHVVAGTTAADSPLILTNAAQTATLLSVTGLGTLSVNGVGVSPLTVNTSVGAGNFIRIQVGAVDQAYIGGGGGAAIGTLSSADYGFTTTSGIAFIATNGNVAAQWDAAGGNMTLRCANGVMLATSNALTNVAGAGAGTITNAPTAGNPTKWISINDNGTVRKIPTWT